MLNKTSCLWKGFDVFQEKARTWMWGCLGKESVLLPHRKGSWEVVLDLLWPICLCCEETISPWLSTNELFLNTPHPVLLWKHWIVFSFPVLWKRVCLPQSPPSWFTGKRWEVWKQRGMGKASCLELPQILPALLAVADPPRSLLPRNLLLLLLLKVAAVDEWIM